MTEEQRQRLAAAYRARGNDLAPPRPVPTRRAPSRDPCPYCEVPGFKGCAHFLPCEPVAIGRPSSGVDPGKRRAAELERRHSGGQYGMGKYR